MSASIKNTLMTFTNLHSTLGKPIIKSNVASICKLLQIMKDINYVYQRDHIKMNKLITDMIQYFEFLCLTIIGEAKVSICIYNYYNVFG